MNNWLICEISHSNCLVCKFFMGVVNSAWWQMQRAACYKINQVQASLLLCLKEFTQFLNDHMIIVETHWFIHTHTRLHFHVFFFCCCCFFVRRVSSGPTQVTQCHTFTATIMQACPWIVLCILLLIFKLLYVVSLHVCPSIQTAGYIYDRFHVKLCFTSTRSRWARGRFDRGSCTNTRTCI